MWVDGAGGGRVEGVRNQMNIRTQTLKMDSPPRILWEKFIASIVMLEANTNT